jgi:glycosyltransferase involved in cell wall biosynthesis
MRLKICHVISGDLWAGAEAMAMQLLSGLVARADIDLFVVVLNHGRLAEELAKRGIPSCVVDERRHSFPEIVGLATRVAKTLSPRLLHSHRYKENILACLVARGLQERPALVATLHGRPEEPGRKPSLKFRMASGINYWLLATRFDKTVAVSADVRNWLLRRHGFREEQVETIRNGIAVPQLPRRPDSSGGFVVGSAGRFVPVKDYPLMVEVARAVNAKTGKIRFELAGEGPMLETIQGSIAKHGLQDSFALHGFVRDMGQFYDGLNAYLSTSVHEGIPLTVLEAMARGIPAIVPRVGGLPEVVTDGVDGYLVDSRTPERFAEKCIALQRNPALHDGLGRAARAKIVERFSDSHMVDAYANLYGSLTENVIRQPLQHRVERVT